MASNVYFSRTPDCSDSKKVYEASRKVLVRLIEDEKPQLNNKIPLKVHFGAKGNTTYLPPDTYNGLIDQLEESGIESVFMETNVVYSGHRMLKEDHIKLAEDHGFTRLAVVIADGEFGDEYEDVVIDRKHFRSCKIAVGISEYDQLFIVSHFKGHSLAGFGGAIKQLAMGCASRGGKLEQHAASKPVIIPFKCKKCDVCIVKCPAAAIKKGYFYHINKNNCVGCAACIAVCPNTAVIINPFKISLFKNFRERIAEYALAAQKDKQNIYISYIMSISKGCDCMGQKMDLVAKDVGVLVSLDPVAVDSASMDLVDEAEGRPVFKGRDILKYAEKIGLGSPAYNLIEL